MERESLNMTFAIKTNNGYIGSIWLDPNGGILEYETPLRQYNSKEAAQADIEFLIKLKFRGPLTIVKVT
jgi:hypothetical protein